MSDKQQYDVIVVGAGISGIGTGYWLQQKCPDKTFAILEARDCTGGTWSLFNYPGIRSDSDMFTFGYRFKPWNNPQSLSSGENILQYLRDTVTENDLDKHILYQHRLTNANWSEETQKWTLDITTTAGSKQIECNFLSICTGYYDYAEANRPTFTGEENFEGEIVIPQFWTKDLDFKNKKVVVIGSGATAITLTPAMVSQGAGHVTMLQRSPTYVMNLPNNNGLFIKLKNILPLKWAYKVARWQNILLQIVSFNLSKTFPKWMKKVLMKDIAKQLPEDYPVDVHFNPSYNPWDQRLCVVPDGDLFNVIRERKADVVTDTISHFTPTGIALNSGENLDADIIVLATGLKIQLGGGATVSVNDEAVKFNERKVYKGMMMSDVPNCVYAFGYTNASWTLKVDLTANYLCKLINYMDTRGFKSVTPTEDKQESDQPFLNLSSGYIQRAKSILPKQGAKIPWRVYQNYIVDMLSTRYGSVKDRYLKFR